MAIYIKKDAKIQFYILFSSFVAITLFFLIPQYKEYLTGNGWVQVDVKAKNRIENNIDTIIKNNATSTAKLVSRANWIIEVKPNSGWGYYFLIRESFGFVLMFIVLFYLLKLIKGVQSENTFEIKTAYILSKIGWLLLVSGTIIYMDKYFINFYVLKELGFDGYKTTDGGGIYWFFGAIAIYFSQYYKRGIELQQENELTV